MGLILHDKHSTSDKAAIRLAARIALKGGTIEGNSGYYELGSYRDDPKPVVLRSSPRSDLKTVEAGLKVPLASAKSVVFSAVCAGGNASSMRLPWPTIGNSALDHRR